MTATSGRVVSVNTGSLRTVDLDGLPVTTGIFKSPVAGHVAVHRLGLQGDVQADLRVHGGPEKAVYFYPGEHYTTWQEVLGRDTLAPGSFGENLTTAGLLETDLRVGDVLRVGTVVLQVLQPRSPCYKLQARFGRPDMVALFVQQAHPGWYASVLEEGTLAAEDPIKIVRRAPDTVTIADVWRYSLQQAAGPAAQQAIARLDLLPAFWKQRILHNASA